MIFVYILLAALMLILFLALALRLRPNLVERLLNRVAQPPPYQVSQSVHQVHDALFIADLHADSLLWSRDLLEKSRIGQVDLPRLQAGNVAFQVFGVVTHFSLGKRDVHAQDDFDLIGPLGWVQGWPPPARHSLLARALYQAERLAGFAARSGGQLRLVGTQAELDRFLADRADDPMLTAAFLGLEGVHALEGDLDNLERLFRAGFRMLGLTHFFDNQAGGSSSGVDRGGLTDWGRALVEKAQSLGIIVDLAHASPQLIDDVLEMPGPPPLVSHGGVHGACGFKRNLDDARIRKIAERGGLVGVALFERLICGSSVTDAARSVKYLAENFGPGVAALGSDFDGAVRSPVDSGGLPLLTDALLAQGVNGDALAGFYGGNFLRLLGATLPEK